MEDPPCLQEQATGRCRIMLDGVEHLYLSVHHERSTRHIPIVTTVITIVTTTVTETETETVQETPSLTTWGLIVVVVVLATVGDQQKTQYTPESESVTQPEHEAMTG
jgi:hypothetical protein